MRKNELIERQLRGLVRDGLRQADRLCAQYATENPDIATPLRRTALRYYAMKLKRSRAYRLAALAGGLQLDEVVNDEFEQWLQRTR